MRIRNSCVRKILTVLWILFPITLQANESDHHFSLELGAGMSYVYYGINASYDYKMMGVDLLFSPSNFPYNYSGGIHGNFYVANGSVIIGPRISFGQRKGEVPFFNNRSWHLSQHFMGCDADIKGYVSRNIFITHQYGIEGILSGDRAHAIQPHYGIGVGFTFGGGRNSASWSRESMKGNLIGFGCGSLLPILITYPLLMILTWD